MSLALEDALEYLLNQPPVVDITIRKSTANETDYIVEVCHTRFIDLAPIQTASKSLDVAVLEAVAIYNQHFN